MAAVMPVLLVLGFLVYDKEPAAAAVETGKAALRRGDYPWYDADKDAVKVVTPPKSRSLEHRDSILSAFFGSLFSTMMTVFAAIVIGILVFLVLSNLELRRLNRPANEEVQEVDPDRLEALPARVRKVDDFLAAAEQAFAEGNLSEAMIFLYSHQLVTLDKAGVIRLAKGKTNRQYLREINANRPDLAALMGRAVRLFEDVYFGDLTISPEAFLAIWNERNRFNLLAEARP